MHNELRVLASMVKGAGAFSGVPAGGLPQPRPFIITPEHHVLRTPGYSVQHCYFLPVSLLV